MTGFEPRIPGIGSDLSTNSATLSNLKMHLFVASGNRNKTSIL